jgi:hypothetical protein
VLALLEVNEARKQRLAYVVVESDVRSSGVADTSNPAALPASAESGTKTLQTDVVAYRTCSFTSVPLGSVVPHVTSPHVGRLGTVENGIGSVVIVPCDGVYTCAAIPIGCLNGATVTEEDVSRVWIVDQMVPFQYEKSYCVLPSSWK